MSYDGVKYRTIYESDIIPSDERITELRKWCKIFHDHDLAPYYPGGTHGNMSFRVKPENNAFIVTAARSSFADQLPDDSFFLIESVNPEKMQVIAHGNPHREPSSETLLHDAIYKKRPEVQAILHGHCNSISSFWKQLGIPVTARFVESGTNEIVESVLEILAGHKFIEIRDHGFMAMEASIEKAGQLSMIMLDKSLSIRN
jgi:ribulose-5-phosphate 4-epimerase/fuculose-1-phosphate aldolase